MKKMSCLFAALFVFSSCTTFQNLLNPDYSVRGVHRCLGKMAQIHLV